MREPHVLVLALESARQNRATPPAAPRSRRDRANGDSRSPAPNETAIPRRTQILDVDETTSHEAGRAIGVACVTPPEVPAELRGRTVPIRSFRFRDDVVRWA